jgi:hypothetical protein
MIRGSSAFATQSPAARSGSCVPGHHHPVMNHGDTMIITDLVLNLVLPTQRTEKGQNLLQTPPSLTEEKPPLRHQHSHSTTVMGL